MESSSNPSAELAQLRARKRFTFAEYRNLVAAQRERALGRSADREVPNHDPCERRQESAEALRRANPSEGVQTSPKRPRAQRFASESGTTSGHASQGHSPGRDVENHGRSHREVGGSPQRRGPSREPGPRSCETERSTADSIAARTSQSISLNAENISCADNSNEPKAGASAEHAGVADTVDIVPAEGDIPRGIAEPRTNQDQVHFAATSLKESEKNGSLPAAQSSLRNPRKRPTRKRRKSVNIENADLDVLLGRNLDDYSRSQEYHIRLSRVREKYLTERSAREEARKMKRARSNSRSRNVSEISGRGISGEGASREREDLVAAAANGVPDSSVSNADAVEQRPARTLTEEASDEGVPVDSSYVSSGNEGAAVT